MYSCPYCRAKIADTDVEDVEGFNGRGDDQEFELECISCGKTFDVHVSVEADFKIVGEKPADPGDVAKFMRKKPSEVIVSQNDRACGICKRKPTNEEAGDARASTFMEAGWRVVPEYPGYIMACPQCLGTKEPIA